MIRIPERQTAVPSTRESTPAAQADAPVAKGPAAAPAPAGASRDGFQGAAARSRGEHVRATLSGAAPTGTPAPKPAPANPDADPMTHIAYLASDALQGRDSPSTGLSAASAYVQQLAQKYGLEGPNTTNPSNPYQQRFPVFSFVDGQNRAAVSGQGPGHEAHTQFGHELFQEGFYLDESMPRDTRELLTQKYEAAQGAAGKKVAPRTEPLSVEQLRQVSQQDGKAENTMALLKGSGPHKDEVIVVMAHLDHVGTTRGKVNNGADDNASGSAVLLSAMPELAEAAKAGKLDRSILFLWTGAEEKGLVGSQYFVDHPIPGLGLDKISGVVNMDMIGRWDDQRLSVVDTNSRGKANYFRDVLQTANKNMADPFDRLNQDINEYRDRQDGAVFSRKGEDVLFLFEGLSNAKGGGELNPDYHQPTDDIEKIYADNNGNKPRRVKDLMVDILQQAANRQ